MERQETRCLKGMGGGERDGGGCKGKERVIKGVAGTARARDEGDISVRRVIGKEKKKGNLRVFNQVQFQTIVRAKQLSQFVTTLR